MFSGSSSLTLQDENKVKVSAVTIEDIDTVKECDYLVSELKLMTLCIYYLFADSRDTEAGCLSVVLLGMNQYQYPARSTKSYSVIINSLLNNDRTYLCSFPAHRADVCQRAPRPEGIIIAIKSLI